MKAPNPSRSSKSSRPASGRIRIRGTPSWTSLVETCPLSLALVDADGVCLRANAAFEKQFGSATPMLLADLFPSAYPISFDLVWTVCQVIGGFRGILETSHAQTGRASMSELLLWRITPPAAKHSLFAAQLQPAGERVRQERNRGDWQARFERAVRISGDGIIDWDLERKTAFFSSRFKSIVLGAAADRPLTLAVWRRLIPAADRTRMDQTVRRHLADPREPFEIEHQLLRRSGEVRQVVLRGQTIADARGKPYRIIGSLRDLTEQRQSEVRTRQLLQDLARAQRQSTAGELAASIAHELNQPLGAITAFAAGAIRRSKDESTQAELRMVLTKIREQALRAGEIIRRLRQFIGGNPTPRTRVDLNPLVREVTEILLPEAVFGRTLVLQRLSPEPLWVDADAVQIQQVMINLIRNALEAVAPLPKKRRVVSISTDRFHGNPRFVVEDKGTGIDPSIQSTVGDSMVSTKTNGLGLGLSLSRSILQAHGGTLLLEPLSIGVRASFTLPAPSASASQSSIRSQDP